MDFLLLLSLLICSSLLISYILGIFYSAVWRPLKLQKYLKQQGFAGPSYKILSGNLKELSDARKKAQAKPMALTHDITPRVAAYQDQLFKKYGKMSMFWIGAKPRVHITDPDQIREVQSNKLGYFVKIRDNPLVSLLAKGVVSYHGKKWAKHRRIISPAFHVEKLKLMLPAFWTSCEELVGKWEQLVVPQGSCEVDVWPDLQNLTAEVISRTAFGSNYAEGNEIFQLQREQSGLILEAALSIYIPGLQFIPSKKNLRRKEISREVNSLLKNIVQKREKAIKSGESQPNDLLGLLLESNIRETEEHGMSIEDVIEECKLFYFAGQETTSTLLTWTMIVLCMHPEWQTRAREEVQEIFCKRKPDFDGLSHLKIMTMILYEVLRLYPPLTALNRATLKEIKLGDITYPSGMQFNLPIMFVHRDPELWGSDAGEFNPERFSGGISKTAKNPAAFFPFGGGPRICIGQNFALIEAKLALSMILQRFKFELSPSYAHAPTTVISLQPQYGAQVILHSFQTK